MRPIDADVLLESMNAVVFRNVPVEHQPYVQAACKAFELVAKNAPTIDAEPVRHGCEYCAGKRVEYQQTKSTKLYIDTHGNTRALGTECNRCPPYARCRMNGIPVLAASPINYCPNCGTKMDAQNKEE